MTKSEAFDRMLKDPSRVFATPDAVLVRSDLSLAQKIEVLRGWERDARELAVADDESMCGDRSSAALLQGIREALRTLGATDEAPPAAPTAHGGAG